LGEAHEALMAAGFDEGARQKLADVAEGFGGGEQLRGIVGRSQRPQRQPAQIHLAQHLIEVDELLARQLRHRRYQIRPFRILEDETYRRVRSLLLAVRVIDEQRGNVGAGGGEPGVAGGRQLHSSTTSTWMTSLERARISSSSSTGGRDARRILALAACAPSKMV